MRRPLVVLALALGAGCAGPPGLPGPGPGDDGGGASDGARPSCRIGGVSFADGTVNPANPCQGCRADSATASWSTLADGVGCGYGRWCVGGACQGYCTIADMQHASDEANPSNACESCQPARSASMWSPLPDGAKCGASTCQAGQCTPPSTLPAAGVLLDGWGGLHPFGGAVVDTKNAPYWANWDIARALALLPDGAGGWLLDGYGGVHEFGKAPAIKTPAYWSGWDIARALVVLADRQSGYLMDGYGGLHAFGPKAPALANAPYWNGFDIARGFEVHLDAAGVPDGGWVLDGWGGVHPFGAAPAIGSPSYYASYDIWYKLHSMPGGVLILGRWGIIERLGTPAGISLNGLPDWGGWDIVRDVVPLSPSAQTAWDTSRGLVCPGAGDFCGGDLVRGSASVLWQCSTGGKAPASFQSCPYGCVVKQKAQNDVCAPPPVGLKCSSLQWWNSNITYGPYQDKNPGNGYTYWWDTDLGVAASTPVQLRHDSKLVHQQVYAWGWQPTFDDQVTGKRFQFLHLRPQNQYTTGPPGTVYPAGTIVGLSGGDTWDTGGAGRGYSTGAHLCVQTGDTWLSTFPKGSDPCR